MTARLYLFPKGGRDVHLDDPREVKVETAKALLAIAKEDPELEARLKRAISLAEGGVCHLGFSLECDLLQLSMSR